MKIILSESNKKILSELDAKLEEISKIQQEMNNRKQLFLQAVLNQTEGIEGKNFKIDDDRNLVEVEPDKS